MSKLIKDFYKIVNNIINKIIISMINLIFDECIKNYKFEFEDDNKRKHKINKTNFTLENNIKKDRL